MQHSTLIVKDLVATDSLLWVRIWQRLIFYWPEDVESSSLVIRIGLNLFSVTITATFHTLMFLDLIWKGLRLKIRN